jgi:hypothetical protein
LNASGCHYDGYREVNMPKAQLRYSGLTKDIEIDKITEILKIEPPITPDLAHDSVSNYARDIFRFVAIIDRVALYDFVITE